MFELSALPKVIFRGDDYETTCDLSLCGSQMQQVGEIISQPGLHKTVGLIFPTCPDLVLCWLGLLAAGKTPVILDYPYSQGNEEEWQTSIRDLTAECGIDLLLCAPAIRSFSPCDIAPCQFVDGLAAPAAAREPLLFPQHGGILQASSGTTGSAKSVLFTLDEVRRHASLYNSVLGMNAGDCMVSWLPLSHCMGLHPCFIMPLLLGIKLVLIDPSQWIKRPQVLFEAIESHGATTCFMPDIGFEIMAKLGASGPFPTMRRWVSSSSAIHPATLEQFSQATSTNPASMSVCYGMAENVFAVSHSDGRQTVQRANRRFPSSGQVIPGTQVKEVSGELFVRSPYSARNYTDGANIQDEDGFYPSGDLGFVENGQVVVRARRQDLVEIEGRSFLLDDLDNSLSLLFSGGAAKVAAIAVSSELEDNGTALLLIEDDRFWERRHSEESASLVRAATGLQKPEIHFVPPYFLPRSSSGEIDRVKALLKWRTNEPGLRAFEEAALKADRTEELLIQFPALPFNQPLRKELNSVGRMVLQLFCIEHGIAYANHLTLESIRQHAGRRYVSDGAGTGPLSELKAGKASSSPGSVGKVVPAATKWKGRQVRSEVFSIVALVDGSRLGFGAVRPFVDDACMAALSSAAGMPVHFEQICVPPAPILFSDLIFCDYFLSGQPDPAYMAVFSIIKKIKEASLILVDDEDNFRTPPFCSYPVLDHRFLTHPEADLLGHRTQRYTQNHHRLPRRVVLGREIRPESINPALKDLENYLGTPMVKMAFHPEFQPYTGHWEFCDYRAFVSDAEKRVSPAWVGRFQTFLTSFITQRAGQFRTTIGEAKNRFTLLDTPHFCSYLLNREAVDFVTDRFRSFCIVGLPSSLPYLAQRLQQLGKPYCFCSEITLAQADYECMVITGGSGTLPGDKPTFDFMHAREEGQGGGRPHNATSEIELLCPSLVACSEQIFRSVRAKYGDAVATNHIYIGNFLLNHTVKTQAVSA